MKQDEVVEMPHETEAGETMPVIPKARFAKIPTPSEDISGRRKLVLRMFVGRGNHASFAFHSADQRKKPIVLHHLYPSLVDWVGREVPDGVNPRSHDPECLKSPVARAIEDTILNAPEDFVLANRGSTLMADSCEYDSKSGYATIVISDPDVHGLADGATTDAVIAKIQTQFARQYLERKDATYKELQSVLGDKDDKIPETLKNARLHLEVWVGITDRTRMANLVQGRNTSRQVKGWSMSDFRGIFDWIKEILEKPGSMFAGKVGYEENSGKDITVLDVISILTLFHPEWDQEIEGEGGDKAPVIAYSNKGRMDGRLENEEILKGYMELTPILEDILKLHDYVYANFETAYELAFGTKAKLGRREGVTSLVMSDKKYELPLTGLQSNYIIPNGFIFPLLAAFRALIRRKVIKNEVHVGWKAEPFKFFVDPENPKKSYGKKLVAELFDQVENLGGNPNIAGKRKTVYTAIHSKAKIALNDWLENEKEKKNK